MMLTDIDFPSIIEDSYKVGFYSDTIQLSEIYLSIAIKNQPGESSSIHSNVLFYLASSYHLTGYTEHSVFVLEREKNLSPLNAFLLAKFYYNLKRYDQFIQFCMSKISYRPESDNANLIIQKFGKYSGFVMKLIADHLYSLNKVSQAEAMLNFSLEVNPFLLSSLNKSVQQDGNRNPFDHFKNFIKSNRKRSSSDMDSKPKALSNLQHNTNSIVESTQFSNDNIQIDTHGTEKQNYNENILNVPQHMDSHITILSPKQIIGTLAASTPMNVGFICNKGTKTKIPSPPASHILTQSSKSYNVIGEVETITSNDSNYNQPILIENTNTMTNSTDYKISQPKLYSINIHDSVNAHKESTTKIRSHQRHKSVHFHEKTPTNMKKPSYVCPESYSVSHNSNTYTSHSLSLPLPELTSYEQYCNNSSNHCHNRFNLNHTEEQCLSEALINGDNSGTSTTVSNLGGDIFIEQSAENCSELQPMFNISSRLQKLPDSLFKNNNLSEKFFIIDIIYKLTKINYYLFRFDCDQVIQMYDQLPQPIRAIPFFISTLAIAFFHKHDYNSCVNIFRHMQIDFPFYCVGFEYYSSALWHSKNLAKLEKLVSFMKFYMPLCYETWIASGNYYNLSKKSELAIQCFKRALHLNSKCYYACALLGKEYWDMDYMKEAFSIFKRGLLTNRFCYQIWYLIAEAHMHKEQYILAEQCINTAIKINPNDPIVWSMAATVDFANNHFVSSITKIDKAIALDPSSETFYLFKVSVLIRVKKWAEARDILVGIIENNKFTKNYAQIYLMLGKIHLNMEDYQTAENLLTKCIEIDLGGSYCAEARKIMGKIGLLQGGLQSKKNSLLDAQSEHYLDCEFKSAKSMYNFLKKKGLF